MKSQSARFDGPVVKSAQVCLVRCPGVVLLNGDDVPSRRLNSTPLGSATAPLPQRGPGPLLWLPQVSPLVARIGPGCSGWDKARVGALEQGRGRTSRLPFLLLGQVTRTTTTASKNRPAGADTEDCHCDVTKGRGNRVHVCFFHADAAAACILHGTICMHARRFQVPSHIMPQKHHPEARRSIHRFALHSQSPPLSQPPASAASSSTPSYLLDLGKIMIRSASAGGID